MDEVEVFEKELRQKMAHENLKSLSIDEYCNFGVWVFTRLRDLEKRGLAMPSGWSGIGNDIYYHQSEFFEHDLALEDRFTFILEPMMLLGRCTISGNAILKNSLKAGKKLCCDICGRFTFRCRNSQRYSPTIHHW